MIENESKVETNHRRKLLENKGEQGGKASARFPYAKWHNYAKNSIRIMFSLPSQRNWHGLLCKRT